MEGILALMIPVLAMATGLVAVLRMPPERLGRGRRGQTTVDAPQTTALIDEVAQLREELARVNERLDFTERLLMDSTPAARLAAPAQAAEPLARV
jgi:chorismate mutase